MFPFVMPSSIIRTKLVNVGCNIKSINIKLNVLLGISIRYHLIAFTPIWSYYKMFGRLDESFVEDNKTHYTKEKQYVICNLGSGCVGCSYGEMPKLTIGKESQGKFVRGNDY